MSSTAVLPQSRPLSQRSGFVLPPRPPIHNRPRTICRSFVYKGFCREEACPRAHVPYRDMLDLMGYLMERADYPPELRSIRRHLTRTDFNRCRKPRPSDRICPSFLDGVCRLGVRCSRAHLQRCEIYRSLLQPMGPHRAREAANPEPEFEATPATPIVPTTSAVAPVLAIDEGPIVKLPDKTDCPSREPSPPNISEVAPVVQLPKNSISEGALISTESDVSKHPQGPTMISSNEIVMPPQTAEQRNATSEELAETDRHPENDTINHSEESSVESSLDSNSAIGKSSVPVDCGVVSAPLPHVHPAPPGLPNPIPPTSSPAWKPQVQQTCRKWMRGRCYHTSCRYLHVRPPIAIALIHNNPPIVPLGHVGQPLLTQNLQDQPSLRRPSLGPNISEGGSVVHLTKNSISDGALISTESDVSKHPQGPTMVSSDDIVMPVQTAERQDATSELSETDWQPENVGTINRSGESSVECSLDSNSAINESTVPDVCGVVSAPLPQAHSAPPGLPEPTPRTTSPPLKPPMQPICQDWLLGRCYRTNCRSRHIPPRMASTYNYPPVVPPGHVKRSLPPQKLQDQPSPIQQKPSDGFTQPKSSDGSTQRKLVDRFTLSVMEATKVDFSGGFSIAKVVTGFESLWFAIENVPKTTKRHAIERLVAPFGTVEDVRFRDENQTGDSAFTVVKVQMASYREVTRAVEGLDGREVFGHPITVRLSLATYLAKRMIRDSYVRVSWPIPSKAGYAGYATLEAAQKAVSKADGMTERKYWVTASMYEGIPVVGAYNVRFMGLPPDTTEKFFEKFGPTEATMMERPSYQAPNFGIPAVRKTLESFGKITNFHAVPPPYKNGWVRVWCRFESPDVAGAACELHRIKQRSLGMVKVSVRRVLSVYESVPRAKFELVEQDLIRLRQNVSNLVDGAHLDIVSHLEGKDPAVRLVAEDSKTLARLRVELSEILDGEVLKENGQQAWDDFLGREAGTFFLNHLRLRNPHVMISVHSFRRCVRLIGTAEPRKSVSRAILAKLSSLRQDKVRSIPLDGQLVGILFSPDLMAVQQRHGEENIRLDPKRQVLCVRGPEKLYEEVQQIIQTVKSRHVTASDDHCPVCLEPPLMAVSLTCGHKWCNTCLIAYMKAASETRSFPITCLGNQGRCTELVSISEARRVLPPADFDALALAAFHAYIQARPGEYHYCPTPDCSQAYPTGPRNSTLSCPSCLVRICPSCHVEYHEGVTCADREDGGDRLFKEWMRTHGVKQCPGCHAPIERSEGCNHMTCTRCHTHTCWVCLDTFPQGEGIYDHMREFHGGIGL